VQHKQDAKVKGQARLCTIQHGVVECSRSKIEGAERAYLSLQLFFSFFFFVIMRDLF